MKYNPKVNEDIARCPGFAHIHPLQPEETVQGNLAVIYDSAALACRDRGLAAVTLQPAAGAHGELTGLMMMSAYHHDRGETGTQHRADSR